MFDTPKVNSFCENVFDLREFPGDIKFEWNNQACPVSGHHPAFSNQHWGLMRAASQELSASVHLQPL